MVQGSGSLQVTEGLGVCDGGIASIVLRLLLLPRTPLTSCILSGSLYKDIRADSDIALFCLRPQLYSTLALWKSTATGPQLECQCNLVLSLIYSLHMTLRRSEYDQTFLQGFRSGTLSRNSIERPKSCAPTPAAPSANCEYDYLRAFGIWRHNCTTFI